jgi:hypothetical protein
MPQMVNLYTEDVIALHLDEANQIIYTASSDGWINFI